MTLTPLLAATPAIQFHAAAALLALIVGIGQFCIRRGTLLHRRIGWVWIVLMAATALSSFFIHQIRLLGPWSPIHLLSVLTLVSLVVAVRAIRRRDRRTMPLRWGRCSCSRWWAPVRLLSCRDG